MNPYRVSRALALSALLAATACTTTSNDASDGSVSDPLESVNRAIFSFNEAADRNVIQPVAEGYSVVVPDPVRDSIRTIIRNFVAPLDITHNLLQGDFQGAATMTGRFMTNTILGFGFNDVATAAGIGEDREDLGQTLAVWGVGSGPYIVVPLLGPTTLRDGLANRVDSLADPMGYVLPTYGSISRSVVGGVDMRSRYLTEIDELRRSSLDYYATMRSLSMQQRNAAIRDNRAAATPEFPNYDLPPQTQR